MNKKIYHTDKGYLDSLHSLLTSVKVGIETKNPDTLKQINNLIRFTHGQDDKTLLTLVDDFAEHSRLFFNDTESKIKASLVKSHFERIKSRLMELILLHDYYKLQI